MRRGKSLLPLARVSERKFRFEWRRDANEREKIVEKESISWGKEFEKGTLFKSVLLSFRVRFRARAPRAKSEGLAGYGSRLLRC